MLEKNSPKLEKSSPKLEKSSSELEIIPSHKIDAVVRLPGSKYIANRLIPLCAMASTPSVLRNIVDNDDIQAAIAGLKALGYQLTLDGNQLDIQPRSEPLNQPGTLNTAHSGTFSRFISAIAALENAAVRIECSDKMATRPMQELFSALSELGVSVDSDNQKLPATICGPAKNKCCKLDAGRSSQFLSALLMIGPLLKQGIEIQLIGNQVSNSYVDMTLFWMNKLAVEVKRGEQHYAIDGGQIYRGIEVTIPGDAVSASYFMGLVGIAGGQIEILSFDHDSLQGESKFYQVLELMGMQFEKTDKGIMVSGSGELKAIEVDMGEMPDVVQTLAVMACFAKGKTHIKNIAHLAYKESNRIKDTATELLKTGIKVEYGEDYLTIEGGTPGRAVIETYDDHRMAMSMALLGVRTKGIVIKDPEVVNKSFPNYWRLMSECGLDSNQPNIS